jgi:RNA polymerase sigma-70 factor (ECF subfamily)
MTTPAASLATTRSETPSPPPWSDEEVVARVRAGEVALFEVLMRRYNQRLFRIARSVLADDAEAEDVAQEAWVRGFQHLAQFDGRARFATWVTKIALYEALARLRRRRRWLALPAEASEGDRHVARSALPSADGNPEQHARTGELRQALATAVDGLPARLRSAFVLREVEGLSTNEAAELLGISEPALKVRLHRARIVLRRVLDEQAGEALGALWAFGAERCNRLVRAVLSRVAAQPVWATQGSRL